MSANISQVVWGGINNKVDKNMPDARYYRNPCVQLKYDGSMYHLHTSKGKAIGFTSKRISVKTGMLNDKLDHFPNLQNKTFPISDCIFVGEVVIDHLKDKIDANKVFFNYNTVKWNKRCNTVAGFMNSIFTNDHYKYLQMFQFVVFDVIKYAGMDVSFLPYKRRLEIVQEIFPPAGVYGENLTPNFTKLPYSEIQPCFAVSNFDIKQMSIANIFSDVVSMGYEGIIVKDLNSSDCVKLKREKTADCVIVGFTDGEGKYSNMIGALVLGVFNAKDLTPTSTKEDLLRLYRQGRYTIVGKASGFSDEQREDFTRNKKSYFGDIVECTYMEWTGKKMRHPRFSRFRDDKQINRVTLDQFEE